MSIAALNQVYDEMRRLAIAGGNLASGDFRLKKLVEPLKASAAKAPVFGKVAEAVEKVVEAPAKESATALLELSTLVTAILYTQGETGAAGKIAPILTADFGMPSSNTSARTLKPLIEALTTTGSGREEIIKDAHQRGAFKDLRLVRVTLNAIDDVYGPIADFVADQILPTYGKAIYDDLVKDYDPKAKGGAVRRLKLMHRLDPEKTREHVQAALDSGSADMKVTAIECLKGSKEALPFLLEQAKAKSTDVRRAALGAMAEFTDREVVDALIAALSGKVTEPQTVEEMIESGRGADIALAAEAASQNRSPRLLTYLLTGAETRLDGLATIMKKHASHLLQQLYQLLQCFATRDDDRTIAFLTKCFERRDEIGQLKGDIDGQQFNRRVAELLVRSNLKPIVKMVANAHATLSPEVFDWALMAAVRSSKPKEVYDLFAPYYLVKTNSKKLPPARRPLRARPPAAEAQVASSQKRESVRELLSVLSGRHLSMGHPYGNSSYSSCDETIKGDESGKELDPRWLDAAVESEDLEMVQVLARPKHKGACELLSAAADQMLKKKGEPDYELAGILETMIRIEHPRLVELFLPALKKSANTKRSYYYYYGLPRLIPLLPKSAAPQIEALLPTLGDAAVDQIAPYLAELQGKG